MHRLLEHVRITMIELRVCNRWYTRIDAHLFILICAHPR
jgi:hypothetical protein